jgi:hypothetical protein
MILGFFELLKKMFNLFYFSETLQPLDLAPPTKQLMRLREHCQLEKVLNMPSCTEWILDPQIIRVSLKI